MKASWWCSNLSTIQALAGVISYFASRWNSSSSSHSSCMMIKSRVHQSCTIILLLLVSSDGSFGVNLMTRFVVRILLASSRWKSEKVNSRKDESINHVLERSMITSLVCTRTGEIAQTLPTKNYSQLFVYSILFTCVCTKRTVSYVSCILEVIFHFIKEISTVLDKRK